MIVIKTRTDVTNIVLLYDLRTPKYKFQSFVLQLLKSHVAAERV